MVLVTNYKLAELQLGECSAMSNEALPWDLPENLWLLLVLNISYKDDKSSQCWVFLVCNINMTSSFLRPNFIRSLLRRIRIFYS